MECPRRFAGFVSLRGGICQPNLRRGRRLVNGKVESTNGKKEFTEGEPVNIRVHSRDSRTYAAAFSRGRRLLNGAVMPPSGEKTYRGRAGECPRTSAEFVG